MTNTSPDLNATSARQGRRGMHVLWILVAALILVIAGFGIVYATHAGKFANKNGNKEASPAAAASFHAPENAPKQEENEKAPGVPGSPMPTH
jgi:flagellar basal body-associated protein FliL